jgi:hypothetical protein
MTSLFGKRKVGVDVNKSHDEANGGSQREKAKPV